jgi:sugar phosphate isomerase/epimerase
MKIGIFASNLKMGVKESIVTSAKLGAEGVQLWNSSRELTPWDLDKTGRADLLHLIKSNGMVVAALCAEFNGGFGNPEVVEERVAKTKEVIAMAPDLEATVISAHVGVIPEDPNDAGRKIMAQAMEEVGQFAEKLGCVFAVETGPEAPELMARFFSSLKTKAMKANYDPANLLMRGYDPIAGVKALKDYIVHCHAKDGARLPDGKREEMPLGKGGVGIPAYIAALREIGYEGFVTVERESGDDREGDIRRAVEYLRTLM